MNSSLGAIAALAAMLTVAPLVAGCGGDEAPGAGAGGAGATAAVTTSAGGAAGSETSGGTATKPASGGAVPDPCTLLSPADLTAILGSEHGTGRTMSVSPDRSTCMYPNGTITAVEVARNYEASREIIDDQGRQTEDVAGVGSAAFYDPAGQIVVKGDNVFVAVTAFGISVDKLKQAAAKLLEAAE